MYMVHVIHCSPHLSHTVHVLYLGVLGGGLRQGAIDGFSEPQPLWIETLHFQQYMQTHTYMYTL